MAREFIRQLSGISVSLWADFVKEVRGGNKACPKEIANEILKDNAMSVYDRQTSVIEMRIASALTFVRRIDDFHGIAFSPKIVIPTGFTSNKTPASLFDTTLRSLHFDIVPTETADVAALAVGMAQGRIFSYDKKTIIEYVRTEMKDKRWLRTDVFRNHASNSGELMALHWRDYYLELGFPA
jgi:hypothetical protein